MLPARPTRRLAFVVATLAACGGGDLVLPATNEPATIQVEGDGQSGRVGTALDNPIVALVSDREGRPVADVPVAFAFADSTGAAVAPDSARTGDDGRAAFEVVLGTRVGPVAAELRVPTAGGTSRLTAPVTLTAVPADANELSLGSGNDQSAPVGTPLPDPLVVQATDAFGNPIAGVTVEWSADGGGTLSEATTTTGPDGLASVQQTLGPSAGTQHAAASATGLAGSPVEFTHTAMAGAAATLERVSGDGQSAVAGTSLPDPLVVRAHDADGNPVPGLAVSWVVGQGKGDVAPATTLTGDDGTASTRWTLGAAPGANTVTAVLSGVGTVGFTATGDPGAPPGMALETQPPAAAVRGVAFATAPVVQLREPDGSARHLAGVGVTVTLQPGGAALQGTRTQQTDANGRAAFPGLAIEGPPGGYTLAFSASGYSSVGSGTITLARAPTTTTIVSDDPDPSEAGAEVHVRYTVSSPGGTPDGNVRVVSEGGPSCSGTVAAGECTLSPSASGTHTLTATYAGSGEFESSAGTEPHTVNASLPPVLALVTQPSATAVEGETLGRQPVVQLRDAHGANIETAGVQVTVAIASGGGTLGGTVTRATDRDGRTGFTDLSISGATGSHTLGFSAPGYTPVTSGTIDVQAAGPVATTTRITADDPDPSDSGQAVAVHFTVTAASGAPTGAVTVTASGGGETCSATVADGACSLTLITAGARTLTASYAGEGGFAGSSGSAPHTVRAPPSAPSPTTSTVDVKDASIGLGKSTDVTVVVRDATGSPIKGVSVTLSATGDGNRIDPASATSKEKGDARFKFSSTEAGSKTLTAVAGGVTLAEQPTVTVLPAGTTTAITSDAPDPSAPGTPVTVGFQVRSDAGTPTGPVMVSASTGESCPGTAPSGTCTLSLSTEGAVSLTATYAGGGSFASSSGQASHQVQAPTRTSIVSDEPDPSAVGETVTVAFSVESDLGAPTGTVTVTSDGGETCSAAVGDGSCPITFKAAGPHSLTAAYAGDARFGTSVSAAEPHAVTGSPPPPPVQ